MPHQKMMVPVEFPKFPSNGSGFLRLRLADISHPAPAHFAVILSFTRYT